MVRRFFSRSVLALLKRRTGVLLPGAGLLALAAHSSAASAQKPVLPLPPPKGLSMVQTLTTPTGDRESVHSIQDATTAGLRWIWNLVEVSSAGDTVRQEFKYAELGADIRDAKRLWVFHDAREIGEHPGYTMHSISRATYRQVRTARSDSFQVMTIETPGAGGLSTMLGPRPTPVRWRGTITLASPSSVPFPLLVNGQRVTVPALHLRGEFTWRSKRWTPELWILADSAYPMMLKWIGAASEASNVLQTIRIDFPTTPTLEQQLEKECRAELPGIYFAFNSAVLDTASNRAIAFVAEMLGRHPDWSVTLEGHTDSIGSAGANRALSERRVAAVRDRLVSAHRVDQARLRASGFGSARPREPNTTIEGRARNRRVELVRECTGSKP